MAVGAVVLLGVIATPFVLHRLARTVQEKAIEALENKFGSNIEFKSLQVSLFPSAGMRGEQLILRRPDAGDLPPFISIDRFTAKANPLSLLRPTPHIRSVRLEGLKIHVPPRKDGASHDSNKDSSKPEKGPVRDFVIDEIVADGTVLTVHGKKPGKPPLEYDLQRLTLHGGGPSTPMAFDSILVNAKPPGDIQTRGSFGPFDRDEPGASPVSGNYTFQNADLSVFRGIAGILSSTGSFRGELSRIEVDGQTDTPDFALKVSGNPVHLKTQFHAVVDGTDGDTYLQPVRAQFGNSTLVAEGSVAGQAGVKGKTVTLNVVFTEGKLEDVLRLAVKGNDPFMSGAIQFRTKLVVPPGDVDVAQKLKLDGQFEVDEAHFSKATLQDKIDTLSHRAQGEPQEGASGSVASDFRGRFMLQNGVMTLRSLGFRLPGLYLTLNGTYELAGGQIDFHGTAHMEATLSETTTGFKSLLLKAVDPLFKRGKSGAVIPIKIGGTRESPSFGLDIGIKK